MSKRGPCVKVYRVWLLPVTVLFWEFYTRQYPDSSSVTKKQSILLGQETGREVLAGRDTHWSKPFPLIGSLMMAKLARSLSLQWSQLELNLLLVPNPWQPRHNTEEY